MGTANAIVSFAENMSEMVATGGVSLPANVSTLLIAGDKDETVDVHKAREIMNTMHARAEWWLLVGKTHSPVGDDDGGAISRRIARYCFPDSL